MNHEELLCSDRSALNKVQTDDTVGASWEAITGKNIIAKLHYRVSIRRRNHVNACPNTRSSGNQKLNVNVGQYISQKPVLQA